MFQKSPHKRVLFSRILMPVLLGLFGAFGIFLITVVQPLHTYAATNSTINFQARLLNSAGAIVPDGTYNLQFKLYSASSGGSALWTETYLNSASQGVSVADGYLTVNLGSITAFPGGINWNQQLWLGMNVGGTSTGSPVWDGEMNPRLQVTAVPYALSAGSLSTYNSSNGYSSSLVFTAPTTANDTITLPDATGTVCLEASPACGFVTGTGSLVNLQATTPGTPQTGNINITGTEIAGNLQAGGLDTATAGTLTIGQTNATGVTIDQTTTLAAGASLIVTGANAFPSSPVSGQIFFNTANKQLYTYENGQWQASPQEATEIVTSASTSSNYQRGNFVVPAGSTTAQTTINNAIAALPAAGGVVYLAEGTYTVSGNINLPSNVSLVGSGQGATNIVALASGATTHVISTNSGAGNIQISNLSINGNYAAGNSSIEAIYLYTPGGAASGSSSDTNPGVQVSDVSETNSYEGLYITGGGNSTVNQSTFDNNGYSGIQLSSSYYNTITSNTVQNTGNSGATYAAGIITASGQANKFENNSSDWNNISTYSYGLWNDGDSNDTFSGNDLTHNSWAGFYQYPASAHDNTISGNTLNYNEEGVDLEAGGYDIVTGNSDIGNSDCGLRALGGLGNNISGNTSNYNGFEGICVVPLNGSVDGSVVNDNTLDNNGSIGILFGTVNNGQITGNQINNDQTGGISLTGNNNTVTGNNITYSASAASTTLNMVGGLSSSATSLTVTSNNGFPKWTCGNTYIIQIDSEQMVVTACGDQGNTWTIQTRGYNGTTAAAHSNGATVTQILPAGSAIDINSGTGNYLSNNIWYGVPDNGISDNGTGTIYAGQLDSADNLIERPTTGTNAFQVQNSAGTDVLSVDTADAIVNVGGNLDFSTVANPTTALTATASGSVGAGNLSGTYYYQVIYNTNNGHTAYGPSATVTVNAQNVNLTNIPISPSNEVVSRSIYRGHTGQPAYFVTTIANNTSTGPYLDSIADGSLGAEQPSMNTTGGVIEVNGSPILTVDSGSYNLSLGSNSLPGNAPGNNDISIGANSMEYAAGLYASQDIAIGNYAQQNNYGAFANVSLGNETLQDDQYYGNNVVLGNSSEITSSNTQSVAVGNNTLEYENGTNLTVVGYEAGTSDNNGFSTNVSTGNLYNSTAIGAFAQVQADNSLVLGATGSSAVNVGIGTTIPLNTFSVSPIDYSTGTASQSGTTITGSGTTWSSTMVGEQFIFANGYTAIITAYNSPTSLTAGVSQSVGSQNYRIQKVGFQVTSSGSVGVGVSSPTTAFQVGNGWSTELSVDTVNSRVTVGDQGTAKAQLFVGGSTSGSAVGSINYNPLLATAVSGNYSYALNNSSNLLEVYNITTPTSPSLVNSVSVPTTPESEVVSGNYLYVNDTSGVLYTYSISSPTTPTLVNTYNVSSHASGFYGDEGVTISGNYIYLSGANMIVIISIASPSTPTVSGYGNSGGSDDYNSVSVSGNYAYLTNYDDCTLDDFNVSNPASPAFVNSVLISHSDCDQGPTSVTTAGNYAYITSTDDDYGNQFQTYNISNPAAVSFVTDSSISDSSYSDEGSVLQGSYVYVDTPSHLYVFSIATPSAPSLSGSTSVTSSPQEEFAVSSGYAYLAINPGYCYSSCASYNSFQVYSVSNPASPSLAGGTSSSASNLVAAYSIDVQGSYTYVVGSGGFYIYDTTVPTSPVEVSGTILPNTGTSLVVKGKYAYISGVGHLFVYDISNPYDPLLLSNLAISNSGFTHLYVTGNYAYVVDTGASNNVFSVYDISDPSVPVSVGTVTANNYSSIYVSGRYAYVTDTTNNHLVIFDISNPAAPSAIETYSITAPTAVYVQGAYAYVTEGTTGASSMAVVDISDPTAPSSIGSVSMSSGTGPNSIFVQGDYAYVATYSGYFNTYDVTNPQVPDLVNSVFTGTASSANSIFIQGRYGYVATEDSTTAFQVYDLGGAYVQQLQAGSIQTGNIQVDGNSNISGDQAIQGGLIVGQSLQVGSNLTVQGGINASGATLPTAPTNGMIFYDTTTNLLMIYENGTWKSQGAATGAAFPQEATEIVTSTDTSANYSRGNYIVPSGSTSAETTINNAISALPSSGGLIYMAEGTYIVDGPINLPSNVTLMGAGQGATIIRMKPSVSSAPGELIDSNSTNNVVVSNLTLDGNYANNSTTNTDGIYYYGPAAWSVGNPSTTVGLTANNITVENFGGSGIYVANSTNDSITNSAIMHNALNNSGRAGIYEYYSSFVNINGNTIQDNGYYYTTAGIDLIGGSFNNIEDNTITENTGVNNYVAGIFSTTMETSDNIVGNNLSYNQRYGAIIDVQNSNIVGNTFDHDGYEGLWLEGGGSNNTITGNNASYDTDFGIGLRGSSDTTISGNTTNGNGFEGIVTDNQVGADNNNTITGNTSDDNGSNGISVGASTGTIINDNHVSGNQGSSIEVNYNDSNTTVEDNYINDAQTTTTLSGNLSSSATSMTVASDTGFPGWVCGNSYVVQIDSEQLYVAACGDGTTTWPINNRGYNSTTAAAHSSGATVTLLFNSPAIGVAGTDTYVSGNVVNGNGQTGVVNTGSNNAIVNQETTSGNIVYNNGSNSTTAYQFQNAGGTSVFDIDTTNQRVGINTSAPSGTLSVVNTSGLSQTALFVNQQNTSQNTVQLQSNGTTIFTVGGTGATTIENSTNSTTALEIQNSSGVNLFDADTSDMRISIGAGSTGESSVTVLVLDNKTSSGDPTGVLGAMYYSASMNEYRCYTTTGWSPCQTPPIDQSFSISDDFFSGGSSSGTIGSANWISTTINSALATIGYDIYSGGLASSAIHPGVLSLTPSSYPSKGTRISLGSGTNGSLFPAAGDDIKATVGVSSISSSADLTRVGIDNETSSGARGTSGIWWEFDPTISADWQLCSANNGSAACVDSGVTVAASTFYRLEIQINGSSSATGYINGTAYTSTNAIDFTTNTVSPAYTCMSTSANSGDTSDYCSIDYYQIRGETGTR